MKEKYLFALEKTVYVVSTIEPLSPDEMEVTNGADHNDTVYDEAMAIGQPQDSTYNPENKLENKTSSAGECIDSGGNLDLQTSLQSSNMELLTPITTELLVSNPTELVIATPTAEPAPTTLESTPIYGEAMAIDQSQDSTYNPEDKLENKTSSAGECIDSGDNLDLQTNLQSSNLELLTPITTELLVSNPTELVITAPTAEPAPKTLESTPAAADPNSIGIDSNSTLTENQAQ